MHILFDARLLHRPLSGLERVQRNLIRELARRPEIRRLRVVVTAGTRLPEGFPAQVEVVEAHDTEDILAVLLPEDAADRPDVYHLSWFPDRSPRDLLLLPAARAAVVEVHDAILNRHPEYHPNEAQWAWYHEFVRQLVAGANRLLVHSASVAQEVVRDLGGRRESCDIAPLAVDPSLQVDVSDAEVEEFRRQQGIENRYFVALGKDYPHKDHATMFRALAQLPEQIHIIVAGEKVWHNGQDTDRLIAKLGLQARVRWISGLSDDEVKAMLQGSAGLIYPSLEEGFGLPPIEAMWHGVPVLAAKTTSIPEVCGDGAWLFPAGDDVELAAGMRRLLERGPDVEALIARGRARAATFSWERCAEEIVECYQRAQAAARESGHDALAPLHGMLANIAACPHGEGQELRAWQHRCESVENQFRELEGLRDQAVRELQDLQRELGRNVTPSPDPAVIETPVAANGVHLRSSYPRWSLRRRLRKIRTALFGESPA